MSGVIGVISHGDILLVMDSNVYALLGYILSLMKMYIFSYIVYDKCMAYHDLSASKTRCYFTMVSMFQNTILYMVFMVYHGSIPWFSTDYLFQNTMVFTME